MDYKDLLDNTKVVAVVGLSDKPHRDSYEVAEYLIAHGFKIIPVNPNIESAFGLKSYPTLLDIPEPVDVVNVFRRANFVPEIVDQAIKIGAKAVWLQEGISHPSAEAKARQNGLQVVSNACMMKTHRKLDSKPV